LLPLAFLLVVAGCDSTGASSEEDSEESTGEGAVSMTLARSANSSVPSDAETAFIRIFHLTEDYDSEKQVEIPDPGQQTEVEMEVPPYQGQGYRVTVLAVDNADERRILASGSSDNFYVEKDDTTQVDLDMRATDFTLEAPESIPPSDSFPSSDPDTIKAIYDVAAPGGIAFYPEAEQEKYSSFSYSYGSRLERINVNEFNRSSTGGAISASFEISGSFAYNGDDPQYLEDGDTTYVKATVEPEIIEWENGNFDTGYFPKGEGTPSFAIPVEEENDNGTVVITFSKNGDSWEKTRVPVD
jgi:hypothetical protein